MNDFHQGYFPWELPERNSFIKKMFQIWILNGCPLAIQFYPFCIVYVNQIQS